MTEGSFCVPKLNLEVEVGAYYSDVGHLLFLIVFCEGGTITVRGDRYAEVTQHVQEIIRQADYSGGIEIIDTTPRGSLFEQWFRWQLRPVSPQRALKR